jgi:hypothetical protein
MLDSEATYRVLAVDGDLAEVEVIDAPGLEPGQRFRFAADAVAAMEDVSRPAADEERLHRA